MEFRIRELQSQDYQALCMLYEEIDGLHRDHLPHIFQAADGPARDQEFILGLIGNPFVGFFVAELDGELVGFAHVILRESPEFPILVPRRYAVLDEIVIKETYHQRGIGQSLLRRAEQWALEQGATEIELNVYEFNQGAIAFYHKLGYATLSRKMRKSLPSE